MGPLVFVLQGCVAAAFVLAFNATAALLADIAPPRHIGQAIGWLGGANVAMNAIATLVAEPLAMRYGWHVVFQLGVGAGLAALLFSFTLSETHGPARAVHAPVETARAPRKLGETLAPILIAGVLIGAHLRCDVQLHPAVCDPASARARCATSSSASRRRRWRAACCSAASATGSAGARSRPGPRSATRRPRC